MTFSPIMSGTAPHHNKFSPRGAITPQYLVVHHWAGVGGGDSRLLNPTADVSCNYILYGTGALIGQVPEEFRAWTSGSWNADAPAITVETQNSANGGDWPVSDDALETLAMLAADLSTRYNWGSLDRSRVRGHREFAQTACPGPYLWARLDWIVARANDILDGGTEPAPQLFLEEEPMNTIYARPTTNSSPLNSGDPTSARVWAGDNRKYDGIDYSGVWAIDTSTGEARRMTVAEWKIVEAAYAAADRKIPLATPSGNELEILVHVPKGRK